MDESIYPGRESPPREDLGYSGRRFVYLLVALSIPFYTYLQSCYGVVARSFTATALWLVAAGLVWTVMGGIRRVWFTPLSHFPGPKYAGLTLWSEFWWDVVKRGTFMWRIKDMHDQYGGTDAPREPEKC